MGILIAVGLLLQAWGQSARRLPQIAAAVLAMLHPRPGMSSSGDSPVLAGLALAEAVPLTIYALGQIALERGAVASDPHASGWSGMAALALAIPLVGVVTVSKASGWRAVAWSVGFAAAVLGLASILFAGFPSSLGMISGRWPWPWPMAWWLDGSARSGCCRRSARSSTSTRSPASPGVRGGCRGSWP